MSSFCQEYAVNYDVFYQGKDYEREADIIEKFIKIHNPDTKSILDYGCGTGNYETVFSAKGYEIFGIDINEQMLAIAKQKFKDNKNIHFYLTSEQNLIKQHSIDVCICLFDVISYMNTNQEINKFLGYIKKVLVNKGLFIFDFWYGPGVLNLGPEKRWNEYNTGNKNILRLTTPEIDKDNCLVKITYEIIVSESALLMGGGSRFKDIHTMRYFFKNEVELFLNYHGFDIIKFGTWKETDLAPSVNDWSALVISKLNK